jgi:hypothetical protein
MNHLRFVASVAIVAIASFANAQETQEHPGHVVIDWREQLGAEPKVSVNLNQTLLRFVTSAASEAATEVPGLRDIIGQLSMVRVEVYEGLAEGTLAPAADAQAKKLQDAGWTTVVRATGDDNERVNVMMLPNGDSIAGLVVIAAGPGEMAFVNIAGDLNPDTLGKHLGALARLTHNGKVKLEDLINTEALEVLIEESGKGTKTTSPGSAKKAKTEHAPLAGEDKK